MKTVPSSRAKADRERALARCLVRAADSAVSAARAADPKAFSRKRKAEPRALFLQALTRRSSTQRSEAEYAAESYGTRAMTGVGFFKARGKIPWGAYVDAIRSLAADFYSGRAGPKPRRSFRGFHVFGIDGSDWQVPTNVVGDAGGEGFGRAKGNNAKGGECPMMCKVSGAFDARTGFCADLRIGRYKHPEQDFAKRHVERLIELFPKRDFIVVFDRLYCSGPFMLWLIRNGVKFVIRCILKYFSAHHDGIPAGKSRTAHVTWTPNSVRLQDREVAEALVAGLDLRFCHVRIDSSPEGKEILITNLAPEEAPDRSMGRLYRMRWPAETSFRFSKQPAGGMQYSGRRANLVLQDVAASFLAADVCCVLRYQAELIAGIDGWRGKAGSRRVNFSALVGAFKKNAPKRWLADPGSGPPIAEEASRITIPVRPGRKYQRRPGNNRDLMSYKPNY